MHPDREKLDTYLQFVNEEMQTAKLASEMWFRSAPGAVVAENDHFVRSVLRRGLSHAEPPSESGDVEPLPTGPAALRARYWQRVVDAKPVAVHFGAADLDGLDDYFDVATDRSSQAAVARLRAETTPRSPADHLLRSVEQVAAVLGTSHSESCRQTMNLLSTDWCDLVRRCRNGPEPALPTADRVLSAFYASISPELVRQRLLTPPSRSRHRHRGAAEASLTSSQAREMARSYMLARLCFSAEEVRVARRLASHPRLQYALLATQLQLVAASSHRARQLTRDWGTARVLLPFTEAFVSSNGYRSSVTDLAPNPKLITVLCNNLLPAVAGELLIRDAGPDDLDAGTLAAGVQAAYQRGVFAVTIGLFHGTAEPGVVSLSGFSRRVCPAARPFAAFCRRWLPYFFERYPGPGRPSRWSGAPPARTAKAGP
ncbi:hypothetical protein [Micromonospora sp. CA-111912]|uniref:hypothetical protein n=1 Tax=Micromonospora sp. CA-111912 TaxID=3239955 RepID=UPI003D8A7CB8